MSASEDLKTAITDLHARLDSWHAVVEGVAAEAGDDPTEALADPRLEAAQDAFYTALGEFEAATLPVLGMIVLDGEDGEAGEVLEDDFFVHLVVGVSEDDLPERLGAALDLVSAAGAELSARLESAGFTVKHLAASRGELELDDIDDDIDGDGPR
jgi:hypothetical protein